MRDWLGYGMFVFYIQRRRRRSERKEPGSASYDVCVRGENNTLLVMKGLLFIAGVRCERTLDSLFFLLTVSNLIGNLFLQQASCVLNKYGYSSWMILFVNLYLISMEKGNKSINTATRTRIYLIKIIRGIIYGYEYKIQLWDFKFHSLGEFFLRNFTGYISMFFDPPTSFSYTKLY